MKPQSGSVGVVVALSSVSVLLVAALVFGYWAFMGRQDYKNNVDQKVSVAVAQAKQVEDQAAATHYAEVAKNPLTSYVGPAAYGSITVKYPKTWSAYVVDNSNSDPYVDAYFAPGAVPDVQNDNSVFALRIQVTNESYTDVMADYDSAVQARTASVRAYHLPKVPNVVGSKITGQLQNDKTGTMIVLPLRANALEIWVDSSKSHLADFNKYILPNLTFSP